MANNIIIHELFVTMITSTICFKYHIQWQYNLYENMQRMRPLNIPEPFPAFKISAIIVSSLVLLMLVVKVTCLLTGFERHLPNISENLSVNHDEHKFILNETSDHDIVQIQQPTEVDNPAHGI